MSEGHNGRTPRIGRGKMVAIPFVILTKRHSPKRNYEEGKWIALLPQELMVYVQKKYAKAECIQKGTTTNGNGRR